LADSYGLERGVAQALQRRGERFFALLGESLEPLIARRIKLQGVRQAVASFADFCAASPAQHTLVFGVGAKPALSIRVDHALALGLVDGVLGRVDTSSSEASEAPLTATEKRILLNLIKSAVSIAAPQAFQELLQDALQATSAPRRGGAEELETVLQIISVADRAGLIADTIEPTEPMLALSGQYVISGRSGALALGLSLAIAGRASAAQPSAASEARNTVERLRQTLGAARLPLEAVLGAVTMPLTAVKTLSPGSVIPLGRMRGIAPPVELRAAGQTLCAGTVIAERGWYRFLMQPRRESGAA